MTVLSFGNDADTLPCDGTAGGSRSAFVVYGMLIVE